MHSDLASLIVTTLALLQNTHLTLAENGYHYDRPAQSLSSITNGGRNTGGHHFGQLPTVSPLPPVPALPPLPTGHSGSHVHTQSLVQVHPPPPSATASKSIANAYRPPSAAVPQYQQKYLPPARSPQTTYQRPTLPIQPQTVPGIFGQRIQPVVTPSAPAYVPTPTFPSTLTQAPAQPLRIPYGKQAVVYLPPTQPDVGQVYNVGDRQVKQYAVIEIIDNDIEQNTGPFLSRPVADAYRAQIGASGTGAAPPPVGQQINSDLNALVLAQQQLGQQGASAGNDAIALGSGGLGFVRLPNGNVYLGSGSLGYISAQQHSALIQEARTRTGAPMPDPLHFGHGPLGNPGNGRSFLF